MSLNIQMAIKRNMLVLRLRGELDQASIENLKRRVSEIIDKYCVKNLIINMEQVSFMDSSGIGFIIGRYSQIRRRGGRLVICQMTEMVERIFNLSGLKKICLVSDSEEEAKEKLEVVA